jgi:hypothetical protein
MRLLQTELFVSAIGQSFAMQNFCLVIGGCRQ